MNLFRNAGAPSAIQENQEVLLFPSIARLSPDARTWEVVISGWVYEPERDSLWRSLIIEWTRRRLGLARDLIRSPLFERRSRMFLVDNKRGKRLALHLAGASACSAASGANGHFGVSLGLPVEAAAAGSTAAVRTDPRARDGRVFEGVVHFPPPGAFGVISDIDDTLKITGVSRPRREVLGDAFSRPFEAFPGMVRAARHLHEAGGMFFYVSTSPWQLYPSLEAWREECGLPPGEFHLKLFRVKDRTGVSLFADPADAKRPLLEGILTRFPGWQFVLSGDTTQQDPELFAGVAAARPERIRDIWLHNIGDRAEAVIRPLFQRTPHIPLRIHHGRWDGEALT